MHKSSEDRRKEEEEEEEGKGKAEALFWKVNCLSFMTQLKVS